jgi:hypothetical protein
MIMMVLLVAASLIGISSIYKPANVETQPQPQQQPLKPQSPLALPPTKEGTLTKMDLLPPQQKIEQLRKIEDQKLADRLFPHIIKKIDIQNNVIPSIRGVTTTSGEGAKPFKMIGYCPQGSVLIGGGFSGPGDMVNSYLGEGGAIVFIQGTPKQTGHYAVQAYCLTSQLVAK